MKVNKRNLIELVLQAISMLIMLIVTCYVIVDSWEEMIGVVQPLFLITLCGGGLFVIQLVSNGKNRNFLPVSIISVIETIYIIMCSRIFVKTVLNAAFYMILVIFIALDVITILGYIRAKKHGILDEPLFKIKNAEISSSEANIEYGEAYRNIAMHVFLCIITLGIWYLIWTYRTTKFLNKTPGAEQYSPVKKLLLCMFIPMYQTYWFYKHGAKVDAFCQHKGIQNSYLTIICALIPIPLVSSVIMQDKINQICTSK